jgi:carbonic anhydrase
VVDHAVLGSIQYGVAELKIPLLVVLGHENAAVRTNVANIVADLGTKAVLAPAVAAGTLKIVGTRYDLDTGQVEFL